MNQRYFYNNYVRPYLTDDKPRNRMLFSLALDNLHRDGIITDWQRDNWVYPDNNFFVVKSERRRSPITRIYGKTPYGKKVLVMESSHKTMR